MCTIVVKAFKTLKAIKVPPNIWRIHHPDGVDLQAGVDVLTPEQQLALLPPCFSHLISKGICLRSMATVTTVLFS